MTSNEYCRAKKMKVCTCPKQCEEKNWFLLTLWCTGDHLTKKYTDFEGFFVLKSLLGKNTLFCHFFYEMVSTTMSSRTLWPVTSILMIKKLMFRHVENHFMKKMDSFSRFGAIESVFTLPAVIRILKVFYSKIRVLES